MVAKAKSEEKTPQVDTANIVDLVAAQMNVEIIDRAEFSRRVHQALVDSIIPRMYATDLEQKGAIRKKYSG